MDTSTNSIDGSANKVTLEELSKEELIKKCKNYLAIAQKAKHSRDALAEENAKLKKASPDEIIESLTQQKLQLLTDSEEQKLQVRKLGEQLSTLQKLHDECQSKTNQLDIENQSYSRQMKRLSDENEHLITHLGSLEAQITEMNQIGLEQRQQLLVLEENSSKLVNVESEELSELQNMLSRSLEEVKKLKDVNSQFEISLKDKHNEILVLNEQLADYLGKSSELESYKQEIVNKDLEIAKYISKADDLNIELHKNKAMVEKLKNDIKNLSKKLNDNQIVCSGLNADMENANEKLKEKLKSYHGKIVKLAGDVRKIRESKDYCLEVFKSYNKQVNIWKVDLTKVYEKLKQESFSADEEKVQLQKKLDNLSEELISLDFLKSKNEHFSSRNAQLEEELKESMEIIRKLSTENEELQEFHAKCNILSRQLLEYQEKLKTQELGQIPEQEIKVLKDLHETEKQELLKSKQKLNEKLKDLKDQYEREKNEWKKMKEDLEKKADVDDKLISELKKVIEKLESEIEHSKITESKLAEQSGETILRLSKENKELSEKIDKLQASVDMVDPMDHSSLKQENAEMLNEMNEMNQVLKERGETISKQQAYCDELLKKLSTYQETIKQLREDLEDRDREDCDALSTSTVSRIDEINRLKDLEGSWEERYGKLRNYAVKLKAKAKELQDNLKKEQEDKEDLREKLTTSAKTVQTMQTQLDSMQDQVETAKRDNSKIAYLNKENQSLRQALNQREEQLVDLKQKIELLMVDKTKIEEWKKQIGLKVQSLRKELEANTLVRKDYESRLQKLQTDYDLKSKELVEEKDKHQATKHLLQESNNECKKQSVLNLEMHDYERSIKELSAKLERKNEQITKLKNQIDAQKSTVNAVKEQNRLMEEKSNELENEFQSCRNDVKSLKSVISDLELSVIDKESKIEDTNNSLENYRSENEELSTQLSKIIAEHQKINCLLKDEKDHFRSENSVLNQRINQLEDQLKVRQDELKSVNTEYQAYKVRAQSVLRQNQSRDVGLEERLTEEAASLKAQMVIFQEEIAVLKSSLMKMETLNEALMEEKRQYERSKDRLQSQVENEAKEVEKLNARHQQMIQEHNETVRNLKLHSETLSQCYRQQLSEQELRHNREIIELQSKVDKHQTNYHLLQHHQSSDIPSLAIPSMLREEGEGSESVDSINGNNSIHPLEKLLGADADQEVANVKKLLGENETRVLHLTALLSDTEQDLAKHVQMNKVLKEEIRRQQRSVERERHAENLEYMKNVVFKFVTLGSGDERLRLVPVLNTILKLSPDESSTLTAVAKGEKSWANYLPIWSNSPGGSK